LVEVVTNQVFNQSTG